MGSFTAIPGDPTAGQPREVSVPVTQLLADGQLVSARFGAAEGQVADGMLHLSAPARDGLLIPV